jgi:hypothetical protein
VRPLDRPVSRSEDNIEINLCVMGSESMDWVNLVHGR